jgi:hypothetical protein
MGGAADTGTDTVTFVVETVSKSGGRGVFKNVDIGVETLRRNLVTAASALGSIFGDLSEVGDFSLEEVEIGVEVGTEGGIAFIASASGSASFKLKFRPTKPR